MDDQGSDPPAELDVLQLCGSSVPLPSESLLNQLPVKDSLSQAAEQQQDFCVSLACDQKLIQTSSARPSSFSVVKRRKSSVFSPVACAVSTDKSKVNSCQPSCLMMRRDNSLNSPSHDSAIIDSSRSGALAPTADRHVCSTTETSEHEHNGPTAAAAGLQSSRGVSQAGRQRETKSTSRALCVSNDFSASTTQCFVRRSLTRRHRYTRNRCSNVGRSREWHRRHAHEQRASIAGSHRSNPSSLGSHAKRKTNADLGRGQHPVATRPNDWLIRRPNTPTAPGDFAGCDEFCSPGTGISSRDGEEMRRTVEENGPSRKKPHGQSARLASVVSCARRTGVLVDSVGKRGGHVVQKSCRKGFDEVESSTRDRLLRKLEEDRPSATWFSMPEVPGPRPSSCSTSTDHRWREKHRRSGDDNILDLRGAHRKSWKFGW